MFMSPKRLFEIAVLSLMALAVSGAAAAIIANAGSSSQVEASVPPVPQGIPAAKAAVLERERQAIIAARSTSHGKPADPGRRTNMAGPAQFPSSGILNMHQGPFPATEFTVSNFWQGPVGANWLLVYAGAVRNPDGSVSAAVRLYSERLSSDGGFDLSKLGTITLPKSAVLTIENVTGNDLTLRAGDGSSAHFDLNAHRFL
jgi:hypothetical protein